MKRHAKLIHENDMTNYDEYGDDVAGVQHATGPIKMLNEMTGKWQKVK
jgi:hypothetical protein